MRNRIYLFFCLVMAACHSNPQANNQRDSTKSSMIKAVYSGPFDLSRLKLNENLPELMTARIIKREPKTASDKTLLGFEVFQSSDRLV